ncbi:hypothetical protein CDL15_Pgr009474 [Punica granatum]|nr:hypothetical protein CDL15_Pgr009474 [Punica granatum]
MGLSEHQYHHVLDMKSLVPATTCVTPSTGPAQQYGLPLVHRRGPCSPLHQDQPHNPSMIFLRDKARYQLIASSIASSWHGHNVNPPPREQGEDMTVPVPGMEGDFLVTVGLGSPTRSLTLILDTGCDLTWTQCIPCPDAGCYKQEDPYYEPSKSSTYSDPQFYHSPSTYKIFYEDKSYSYGYYARDTLTLGPNYKFPNFVFGCGQNNSSNGFGSTAGILGLGKGTHTLVSQTAYKFNQIFCYCIPPTFSTNGYLLFGLGARKYCHPEMFTPLVSALPARPQYFVNLLSITIEDQTLSFTNLIKPNPSPSSSPSSSSSYKTIIDSGTTITRLPQSVYAVLCSAFQNYMWGYPEAPELPPLLDTCYDLEDYEDVKLPRIVLNFEQANVTLDPSGIIWRESNSQVCLAFSGNTDQKDDLIIIGSTQQSKLDILYDVKSKRVGFGRGSCGV